MDTQQFFGREVTIFLVCLAVVGYLIASRYAKGQKSGVKEIGWSVVLSAKDLAIWCVWDAPLSLFSFAWRTLYYIVVIAVGVALGLRAAGMSESPIMKKFMQQAFDM